jgi:hypothetical protein
MYICTFHLGNIDPAKMERVKRGWDGLHTYKNTFFCIFFLHNPFFIPTFALRKSKNKI